MTGHGRCAPRVRRGKTPAGLCFAYGCEFTPYAQGKNQIFFCCAGLLLVHPVCAGEKPRKAPTHSLRCCSPRMRRGKQPAEHAGCGTPCFSGLRRAGAAPVHAAPALRDGGRAAPYSCLLFFMFSLKEALLSGCLRKGRTVLPHCLRELFPERRRACRVPRQGSCTY